MNTLKQIQTFLKKTNTKPYELADMASIPRSTMYKFLKNGTSLRVDQWDRIRKIIDLAAK